MHTDKHLSQNRDVLYNIETLEFILTETQFTSSPYGLPSALKLIEVFHSFCEYFAAVHVQLIFRSYLPHSISFERV